jgi:hypothetical protein
MKNIAAIDFFVVPTLTFRLLYVTYLSSCGMSAGRLHTLTWRGFQRLHGQRSKWSKRSLSTLPLRI